MERFDLSGRVAIVTGGTRGIGRAITFGLAEAGADVVPTARTRRAVTNAVGELDERYGTESIAVTTDVTEPADVRELVDRTVDELGGIDVLVNNAGINPETALGRPGDVEPEGFDETIDVNLRGAFECARAAEPPLLDAGGSVINVASVGGVVGLPRQHPYVASKHGLVGLTKSMALDWAPEVRVNAIAPGYVATDLTAELRDDESLRESIVNRTPLDRFADSEELAGPAVFLASDAASYVTGAVLAVDGGWSAQ